MGYLISHTAYGRMFGVPAEVVDKHIRLAGAVQLKVLLCLLARPEQAGDAAGLSQMLSLPPEDLADAMQYWISAGLVTDTSRPEAVQAPSSKEEGVVQENAAPAPPKSRTVRRPVPAAKPSREEIVARGEQSKEIAWLLSQAQLRLGRTISVGEMSTLVYLHDTEGLPAEVIAMILEYSIAQGKGNIRYIEKIALSWAQEEIDTLEKAERKLSQLERQRKAWGQVLQTFGMERRLPSQREQEMATRWLEEWHFTPAMLRMAYDVCVDTTGKCSLPYINKVLDRWAKKGISTPEQVRQEREKKTVRRNDAERSTSYDIDEIQRLLGDAEPDDKK